MRELVEVDDKVRADMRKTRIENLLKEKAAGLVAMLRAGIPGGRRQGVRSGSENTDMFTRQNATIPKIGMAPALLAAASS
jgi:hypothetical protein